MIHHLTSSHRHRFKNPRQHLHRPPMNLQLQTSPQPQTLLLLKSRQLWSLHLPYLNYLLQLRSHHLQSHLHRKNPYQHLIPHQLLSQPQLNYHLHNSHRHQVILRIPIPPLLLMLVPQVSPMVLHHLISLPRLYQLPQRHQQWDFHPPLVWILHGTHQHQKIQQVKILLEFPIPYQLLPILHPLLQTSQLLPQHPHCCHQSRSPIHLARQSHLFRRENSLQVLILQLRLIQQQKLVPLLAPRLPQLQIHGLLHHLQLPLEVHHHQVCLLQLLRYLVVH